MMDSDTAVEVVSLNLNFRGTDVLVNVDVETANILLNDPEELEKYFQKLITLGQLTENNNINEGCSSISDTDVLSDVSNNLLEDTCSNLWLSKGRPTEQDRIATQMFLDLRKKYKSQFDDRKTVKMQVWQKIANELCNSGFDVGSGKAGALKCRQKFANLTRTYLGYIKHKKTTGAEKVDEPPFYNDMHEILGSKDKVNPKNLQDSMESEGENENVTDNSENQREEYDGESSSVSNASSSFSIRNRFSNVSNTVKPKSINVLMLEEMKKQHKDNLQQKEKQFNLLETHVKESLKQNQRLIRLMEKMIKKSNMKDDDSESD